MKLNTLIKTATLASVMALGFQGIAFAGQADVVTSVGAGGGPHVRVFNGSPTASKPGPGTGQHVKAFSGTDGSARKGRPHSGTPNSVSNGGNESQVGLLLPAVQKVREAAAR